MATKRFPFVGQMNTRGETDASGATLKFTTYDQLYQNVMFIPIKNEVTKTLTVYVEKRYGFFTASVNYGLTTPQKTFSWLGANSGADIVIAAGQASSVTRIRDASTPNTIKNHADSSAVSFFSATQDSSGVPMLIWQRANLEIWGYPFGGAAAQITTVPAGIVGRMIHLDGWSFIGVGANARIYNSTLNNPTAGYTDYITADKITDRLITVFLYKHFVLAFGSAGIEWFYNAGNPSGSPLSRIKERYIPDVSLYSQTALAQGLGAVFFVGGAGSVSGYGVFKLTESGIERISTPIIDKIIEGEKFASSTLTIEIVVINFHGIDMVMVCFANVGTALVFFPSTGLWSYWKNASNSLRFETLTYYVESSFVSYYQIISTADSSIHASYITSVRADAAEAITRILRTSVLNFETGKRKTQKSLRIIGDIAPTTLPISVSVTDDDYVTNSTARTIDMTSSDPVLHRLGMFRRRAYTFTDTSNLAGRVEGFEVDLEVNAS